MAYEIREYHDGFEVWYNHPMNTRLNRCLSQWATYQEANEELISIQADSSDSQYDAFIDSHILICSIP